MIDRIWWIESHLTDPYENLALEEFLLTHVPDNGCILYLWQNRHTVVIGRNQNAWRECRVDNIEQDGAFLARRLSGGGAVYHDLGNLNFTFLVPKEAYDVDRQLSVLQKAVQSFGIPAEKSGRNDLTADGKKFSGNAFYKTSDRCYHHGTVMVSVNKEHLSHYLQVSEMKLRSKGVSSVRSRVTNLTDFVPTLTIDDLKKALVAAFGQVYGLTPAQWPEEWLDSDEIDQIAGRYASWEWIYGRNVPFTQEWEHRFSWGEVQIQLSVNGGKIMQAACYSDAMDPDIIQRIPMVLEGRPFAYGTLRGVIGSIDCASPMERQICQDIATLLGGELS